MDINVDGSEIEVNGTTLTFESNISEVIEFDDFVVIRLEIIGKEFNDKLQNIIAINQNGVIRWKIEKAPEPEYYDSYSRIWKKDEDLIVYNLKGIRYRVDKETGEVFDGEMAK